MSQTTVDVIKPADLGAAEREAWRSFREANPLLNSPYFALGFLDAVDAARGDTRVLAMRERGEIAGFLPFHKGPLGHARNLGGPLGDHHAIIAEPGRRFDLGHALGEAGISVFDYHGAFAAQREFVETAAMVDGSWVIDLHRGFEAFLEERGAVQPKAFRNLRARRRKLEDAPGGFELRIDDRRPEALKTVLGWKSEQYRRTRHFDAFSVAWTNMIVDWLMASEDRECRGVFSTLEIGGQLVAGHFGMRSQDVMHYWFPAYDPAFARMGPGLSLLVAICEELSRDGVTEVHLGPGDYDFKEHLAAWQMPLAMGFAHSPSMFSAAYRGADAICRASDRLSLPLADIPGRAFRRLDKMASFRAAPPA